MLHRKSSFVTHSGRKLPRFQRLQNIPEAKAVVTIGAPADINHVTANFGDKIAEIQFEGEAECRELAGERIFYPQTVPR